MRRIALAVVLMTFASVAFAQAPVTPTNKLGCDQPAPTLAEAQAYTYRYYPDSATAGTALVAVTCVGTASPYQCEVNFPASTPGSHTLTLTAGTKRVDEQTMYALRQARIGQPDYICLSPVCGARGDLPHLDQEVRLPRCQCDARTPATMAWSACPKRLLTWGVAVSNLSCC